MTMVVIIDSGVANLASLTAALRDAGGQPQITSDPDVVRGAARLVLPGVGHFAAARAALADRGLDRALADAAGAGTPLLGICLGMQLLTRGSEEAPQQSGLGLVDGTIRRFRDAVRVPHLGWNAVRAEAGCRRLTSGYAAFANSFALLEPPRGAQVAWARHGEAFVAGFESGCVTGCQFHPELSGAWGVALLQRWIVGDRAGVSPAVEARGLAHRVIACLDVKDGRIVKGTRFQNLRDSGDPAARARTYQDQGADEIVVLDVAATVDDRATQLETIRRIRHGVRIPITAGGGVRSVADARALLEAGADKVSVNTAAVERPALIAELAGQFGSQCVVLAIDARRRGEDWVVLTRSGREPQALGALPWARDGVARGAGEILMTSWDRDGTGAGCDLELLERASRAVNVPVIASGGVGSRQHVVDAFAAGADAVLAASIFHDDRDTVDDVKRTVRASGYEVRP